MYTSISLDGFSTQNLTMNYRSLHKCMRFFRRECCPPQWRNKCVSSTLYCYTAKFNPFVIHPNRLLSMHTAHLARLKVPPFFSFSSCFEHVRGRFSKGTTKYSQYTQKHRLSVFIMHNGNAERR